MRCKTGGENDEMGKRVGELVRWRSLCGARWECMTTKRGRIQAA